MGHPSKECWVESSGVQLRAASGGGVSGTLAKVNLGMGAGQRGAKEQQQRPRCQFSTTVVTAAPGRAWLPGCYSPRCTAEEAEAALPRSQGGG